MHRIAIFPEVLERIERWRGRRHVYDAIEPRRTALVVIDMQNAWVMAGQPAYAPGIVEIVPNINRIAGALRAAGGTVAWVQMSMSRDSLAGWARLREFFRTPEIQARWIAALTPGAVGYALWAGLDVQPGDEIVVKSRYSALIQGSSDLEARLRARGIDTVIVTGTATNTCCEATARDAMMLDFKTFFVADANAARSDAEHNAALSSLLNLFADVRTTEETVGLIRAAETVPA
ncbi:MAG: cysteine hydrolase [Alphaproteobacteria bacterium]|nr:cysteine hydrolase [Alphaproteobacteria bacterium]